MSKSPQGSDADSEPDDDEAQKKPSSARVARGRRVSRKLFPNVDTDKEWEDPEVPATGVDEEKMIYFHEDAMGNPLEIHGPTKTSPTGSVLRKPRYPSATPDVQAQSDGPQDMEIEMDLVTDNYQSSVPQLAPNLNTTTLSGGTEHASDPNLGKPPPSGSQQAPHDEGKAAPMTEDVVGTNSG